MKAMLIRSLLPGAIWAYKGRTKAIITTNRTLRSLENFETAPLDRRAK